MKEEALRLSLKYSFVTPVTSMVVTKPTGNNTDILNKPGQTFQRPNNSLEFANGQFGFHFVAPKGKGSFHSNVKARTFVLTVTRNNEFNLNQSHKSFDSVVAKETKSHQFKKPT